MIGFHPLPILGRFLAFGFAGWCLENIGAMWAEHELAGMFSSPGDASYRAYEGKGLQGWIDAWRNRKKRYSALFKGKPIPILPVYGFGGLAITTMAPVISHLNILSRAAVYGISLTGLEFVACQADRRLFGACSWDYKNGDSPKPCPEPDKGCIDWRHSIAWAGLALVVERATRLLGRK